MRYFDEARALWQAYVPSRGQADTVQGELIRAVEKLLDEAQRNGNLNWGAGHRMLAEYVRAQLAQSPVFDERAVTEINADVERLLRAEDPDTTGEPHDRLTDRIVEWSRAQPGPVPHAHNPDLHL